MKEIDFIGRTKLWLSIALAFIIISVLAVVFIHLKFSVDFSGGTLIQANLKHKASVPAVRAQLAKLNLQQSVIQPFGKNGVIIRYGKSVPASVGNKVVSVLNKSFGVDMKQLQKVTVGAGWGSQITLYAIWALIFSLSGLMIYISLRFEFKMASAAIIALFHDIIITLGIYALVGREVAPATVAALLTILGYSLYDTIVVFHKVVENSKRMNKQSYGQMVNSSINQVLARSINTTLTSVLPVFAILLFGGDTLKDFAFALAIGLISGAYSSIFIASPLLALWKETEPHYRNLKKKYA